MNFIRSFLFLALASASQADAPRPNFVIILADDMGYADSQPYGGEIQTPHLQRLAEEGLRFSAFYNCAKCSPSRASLLTGVYPQQAGMPTVPKVRMNTEADEDGPGELRRNVVTLAEVLKTAGYATCMTGKWHLTAQKFTKADEAKFGWPRQRGFDRFFGTIKGATRYFESNDLVRDDTPIEAIPGSYTTDLFADEACAFISAHRATNKGKPFLLYIAFNAPHWNLQAPEADIERYRGVFDHGWDAVRAVRFARQKAAGLLPQHAELSPRNPEVPAWDSLSKNQRSEHARAMQVYAAAITAMDRAIGRVIAALEKEHAREDTLVLFMSDNGASPEGRTSVKAGTRRNHDTARIGPGWANAANTPFAFWKNTTWQGGTASPLILNWPAGVKTPLRGGIIHDSCHLIDVMPTCVALAGAAYPQTFKNEAILPMEGRSLLPVLNGGTLGERRLFWEYGQFDSMRSGRWKLLRKRAAKGNDWMLFDLHQDPVEQHDLAAKQPEKVKELSTHWQTWSDRVHAESSPDQRP